MNQTDQTLAVAGGINAPLLRRKKYFSIGIALTILWLTLCVARAAGPDDDYLAVLGIVDQADVFNANGKTSQAHAKYVEAQRALIQFQQANPGWNTAMVSYRVKYVAEKSAATLSQTVSTAANTAVTVASPVKLLAAGSEPRAVLRLHPSVGDKQTLTMTMKMGMTMKLADKAMPSVPMPTMVMTMEVGVKDIAADGDITYDVVYDDATVAADTNTAPATIAAIKNVLGSIRGMNGTGKMSSRGIIKAMEMKLPADADPQLAQVMGQMKDSFTGSSTALPEEAVGPGARWEYKTKLKSQGMTIDQAITYELVAVTGDRLSLRDTLTQNAANQKIQSPAMPGVKVDLNRMTGTGTGGGTYDLTHIMPVTNTLDEKTDISMGVKTGQQQQNLDMKMDISVSLDAK